MGSKALGCTEQENLIWDLHRRGESIREIERVLGETMPRIRRFLHESGGIRPVPRVRRIGHITARDARNCRCRRQLNNDPVTTGRIGIDPSPMPGGDISGGSGRNPSSASQRRSGGSAVRTVLRAMPTRDALLCSKTTGRQPT